MNIDSFKDFSQTEKKLAQIWRSVFQLLQEQYESLTVNSSLLEFANWCVTIEIVDLEQAVNRVFGICTDGSALIEDYPVLSQQAKLIDDAVNQKTST